MGLGTIRFRDYCGLGLGVRVKIRNQKAKLKLVGGGYHHKFTRELVMRGVKCDFRYPPICLSSFAAPAEV